MIFKETTPYGETIVYMNGHLLYKRWPNGRSMIMEKYSFGTTDTDRDRGSYEGQSQREIARLAIAQLSDEPDGDGMSGRAAALLCTVMESLVAREGKFSVDLLTHALSLEELLEAAYGSRRKQVGYELAERTAAYLESLPDFDMICWHEQSRSTIAHHLRVTDQIRSALALIAA